jgi:hypothetical protein
MPATINGTSGFGGNVTGNVTGNADTATKLSTTTGDAPVYACRAWVNFDGTTVTNVGGEDRCLIRNGGNVSKVVRTGAGVYVVYFDKPMQSATYAALVSGAQATNANDNFTGCYNYTTTTLTVQGNNECNGRTPATENMAILTVAVFA